MQALAEPLGAVLTGRAIAAFDACSCSSLQTVVPAPDDSRRVHTLLRDRRPVAGIGRGHADDVPWCARLSPCSRCGETMRRVSYQRYEVTCCPRLQTGADMVADRRLSRLLR